MFLASTNAGSGGAGVINSTNMNNNEGNLRTIQNSAYGVLASGDLRWRHMQAIIRLLQVIHVIGDVITDWDCIVDSLEQIIDHFHYQASTIAPQLSVVPDRTTVTPMKQQISSTLSNKVNRVVSAASVKSGGGNVSSSHSSSAFEVNNSSSTKDESDMKRMVPDVVMVEAVILAVERFKHYTV